LLDTQANKMYLLTTLKLNNGSNMDKPKIWVENVIKKFNPMAGFVDI